MKSYLLLFTPKVKALVALTIINILIIGGVYIGTDLHDYNEYDTDLEDYPDSELITTEYGSHYLTVEHSDEHEALVLNTVSDDLEISKNKIFEIDMGSSSNHYWSLTSNEFFVTGIVGDYILTLVKEENDVTTNYYLIANDADTLSTDEELIPKIIKIGDDNLKPLQIRFSDNLMYSIWNNQGNLQLYAGQEFYEIIKSELENSSEYDYRSSTLRYDQNKGSSSPLSTFSQSNIYSKVMNNETGDTLMKLDMFQPTDGNHRTLEIKEIDSNGRIHIVGKGVTTDIGEGTDYGNNNPDYMVFDPFNEEYAVWDLIPTLPNGNFEERTFDNRTILSAEIISNGNEVLFIIDESRLDIYYSDKGNTQFSSTWRVEKYLQFVVFDPMKPTIENNIQWNHAISQTNQSTVKYPRISEFHLIPDAVATQPGYSFNNYKGNIIGDRLQVFTLLFHTSEGYRPYLLREDGSRNDHVGRSIVSYSFNFTHSNVTFLSKNHIIGPKDLPIKLPENKEDKLFKGWAVDKLFLLYNPKSGDNTNYLISFGRYTPHTSASNILLNNEIVIVVKIPEVI